MSFTDDLFEAQVELEAKKRLRELARDPDAILDLLAERNRELSETKKELIEVKFDRNQIAADYSRLTDADGNYDMKDAAKLLKYQRADGKQVGRNELFAFLRDIQFLNRDSTPAQSSIDNGWADEITGTYEKNGVEHVYVKTVVTPKGLDKIRRLVESAFDNWWAE